MAGNLPGGPRSVAASPLLQHLKGRHDHLCLSLYLPSGPGYDPRYYDAQLKDARASIEATLDDDGKVALDREMAAVRDFIEGNRPTGISVGIFSCVPCQILDGRRLPQELNRQLAYIGDEFELDPLLAQLERRPPSIVAVVEKDQARLFTVVLEDVEEVGATSGRDVRRGDQDGARERFLQQEHQRVHNNIKQAVDWLLAQNLPRRGFQQLYLAGPVQARSEFKRLLPKPWQQAIRGELAVTLDVRNTELADQIRKELEAESGSA
jgi:hypothetical protein